jgi:anti-sigma factor RsiW
MRCESMEMKLEAYVDGELARDEIKLLEAHLDKCAACRRELESRRALRRLAASRPKVTAPVDLQDRILSAAAARVRGDQVGRQAGSTDSRWWRRARWPLALAAAASLALAVLVPGMLDNQQPTHLAAPFTTPARVVVTRFGEQAGQVTPVKFGGIVLNRANGRSS